MQCRSSLAGSPIQHPVSMHVLIFADALMLGWAHDVDVESRYSTCAALRRGVGVSA